FVVARNAVFREYGLMRRNRTLPCRCLRIFNNKKQSPHTGQQSYSHVFLQGKLLARRTINRKWPLSQQNPFPSGGSRVGVEPASVCSEVAAENRAVIERNSRSWAVIRPDHHRRSRPGE